MLRKRLVTLLIETDEGRPEDWAWSDMLFKAGTSDLNTVKLVHWEEA